MEKSLDRKFINKIREMVEVNDHGEAYLMAAREFGFDELAMRLQRINREHKALGYLSMDAYHDRHRLYEEIMEGAKALLTPNDYSLFHRAM